MLNKFYKVLINKDNRHCERVKRAWQLVKNGVSRHAVVKRYLVKSRNDNTLRLTGHRVVARCDGFFNGFAVLLDCHVSLADFLAMTIIFIYQHIISYLNAY
jgi:hypothetical protein